MALSFLTTRNDYIKKCDLLRITFSSYLMIEKIANDEGNGAKEQK